MVHSFVTAEEVPMRRLICLMLPLLVVLACASGGSSRPKNIPQPAIELGMPHDIFFGSGNTAPATIEVRVLNRATVPIRIRRIEVESPGMMQYGIQRTVRDFGETIPPGESKSVSVFATAITTVRRPTEPLTLRAVVDFEAPGGVRWREFVRAN